MEESVLESLADVVAAASDDDVVAAALRAWRATVRSDYQSFMRRTESTGAIEIWLPVEGRLGADHRLVRLLAELWASEDQAATHPCAIAFLKHGPGTYVRSALEADDIWHSRPHYQIVDKAFGIRDMVSVYLVPSPGTLVMLHAGSYGDHFHQHVLRPATIFGRILAGLLRGRSGFEATHQDLLRKLTTRETQILELIHGGLRNAEIASRLGISALTVRKHLENIFAKLGVDTRTAAAAMLKR